MLYNDCFDIYEALIEQHFCSNGHHHPFPHSAIDRNFKAYRYRT